MAGRPIVAISRAGLPGDPEARLGSVADVRVWKGPNEPSVDDLAELASGAEGILCAHGDPIGEPLLDRLPGLRIVALAGVGYDFMDLVAAARHNVVVTNTPGVLREATADLAFGLILAARRRIVEADRYVRAGRWSKIRMDLLVGLDVHGARLGIVGFGENGQGLARRGHGFEMDVVHFDVVHDKRSRAPQEWSRWVPLDELLATSDVVSLHVPLTAETRCLIGEAELRQMKPTATLVNTSRGGVVDQPALIRALQEGWIGSAGLDVQAVEPNPDPMDVLLSLPNCVVLPHIGSATVASRERMVGLAADNIVAVLAGNGPLTPVALATKATA